MTFGSLFAGIGGFDLGLERAGMTCRWQVEIDEFCQKVLEKHWPNVPKFRDIRDCGKHNLPAVDLICGGFPCQDVSVVGKRAGIDGARSGLWSEFARIIRVLRPRYVIVENVPGLLSAGVGRVLGDLASCGYDAEWKTLWARQFGLPHARERLFILAYPKSFRCFQKAVFIKDVPKNNKKKFSNSVIQPHVSGSILRCNRIFPTTIPCGVDDGLSHELDRLKSLGNAVVPQCAEFIGRRIMEVQR